MSDAQRRGRFRLRVAGEQQVAAEYNTGDHHLSSEGAAVDVPAGQPGVPETSSSAMREHLPAGVPGQQRIRPDRHDRPAPGLGAGQPRRHLRCGHAAHPVAGAG
jgi:hypothetical protein